MSFTGQYIHNYMGGGGGGGGENRKLTLSGSDRITRLSPQTRPLCVQLV